MVGSDVIGCVLRASLLGAATILGAGPVGALAGEARDAFGLSELRLGSVAHDPLSLEAGSGADLKAEALFNVWSKDTDSAWGFLTPRVLVGTTVSFHKDKTSQFHAGVAWTYDFTKAVFFELTFGGAVHNGWGGVGRVPGRSSMGCNVSFHESASAGYRLTANWSIMATVEHTSNGGLCSENTGLSNFGVKVGYSF